jgi:hypothetical protein
MATKKSKKISARQRRIGEVLGKDRLRQNGGLIHTVRSLREREWRMGKLGAASPCRRIDPETGEVIKS